MRTIKVILLIITVAVLTPAHAQSKWNPYVGLHASMDPERIYFGPSYQLGVDYQWKKRITPSVSIHYFPAKIKGYYAGVPEQGKYSAFLAKVMVQFHNSHSKNTNHGIFLGGGVGVVKNF